MTLDAIDMAFVARWETQPPVPGPPPERVTMLDEAGVAAPSVNDHPALRSERTAESPAPRADDTLVERLLAAAPEQWNALADEIEAARLAGRRVIAITGGERGEGRSTLVACIGRVLRQRGREVEIRNGHHLPGVPAEAATGGHDGRIVLVDAGSWFPAGPIRRQRLMVTSVGSDAAILVRRADREPAPMRAAALEALGIAVLGEVVTFAACGGLGGGENP